LGEFFFEENVIVRPTYNYWDTESKRAVDLDLTLEDLVWVVFPEVLALM
jgi:hypothetical protein